MSTELSLSILAVSLATLAAIIIFAAIYILIILGKTMRQIKNATTALGVAGIFIKRILKR